MAALSVGAERDRGLALPGRLHELRGRIGGRGDSVTDVFRRLAFMVCCSAWAAVVALVWLHLGWIVGASAIVGGNLLAFLVAADYDFTPDRPAVETTGPEAPRGLGHRELSRRARAARGADDDD